MKDYSFLYEQPVFTYSDLFSMFIVGLWIWLSYLIVKWIMKVNSNKAVKPLYIDTKSYNSLLLNGVEKVDINIYPNTRVYKEEDVVFIIDRKYHNSDIRNLHPRVLCVVNRVERTKLGASLWLEKQDHIKLVD